MSTIPGDLDYTHLIKRAFSVAIRPENLFVLLFGAAVVALGSLFSGALLAGPLGVGYIDACRKMVEGKKAEMDDIIWRGFDRWWAALSAGVVLGLLTAALSMVLVVPGMFALLFSGLVYGVIAFDAKEPTGMEAIQRVWSMVLARPAPFVIMGLIASAIGSVLTLTVVGTVVMVAFFYLLSVLIYIQCYEGEGVVTQTQVS